MQSKNLEKTGLTGRAACLARNSPTKNIVLEMSPNEVVYEQSISILTSEELYDTIKVVNVTNGTEVTCKAEFDGTRITANKTLPAEEKKAEEPVAGKVCNTVDTPAQDTEEKRVNMLSMAVLGLRVLLAKSIAFNTLMSIKLILF